MEYKEYVQHQNLMKKRDDYQALSPKQKEFAIKWLKIAIKTYGYNYDQAITQVMDMAYNEPLNEDDKFKPTLNRAKGKMAKAFEKDFKNVTNKLQLENVDQQLNEKEQSFKKKIFDLAKMESLVHSDDKLNGIYNKMAETGEEDYGYHHNETIMNIVFNNYVLGNSRYLQKYKMAIPVDKKRRDISGTRQLQRKLGTTPEPNEGEIHNNSLEGVIEETESHGNFGVVDGMGWDIERDGVRRTEKFYDTMEEPIKETEEQIEEQIEETTSAGGSAGTADGSSRVDGYSYVGPFGKRNKDLDKPMWKGGQVIGESEYLYDPKGFKEYYNILNEGLDSPNNDSKVPMAEDIPYDADSQRQMLERVIGDINELIQNTQKLFGKKANVDNLITQGKMYQQQLTQLDNSNNSQMPTESVEVYEHHLNSNEDKASFIANELKNLSDEELTNVYNQIEKYLGMIDNNEILARKSINEDEIISLDNLDNKSFTNREILKILHDLAMELDASGYYRYLDVIEKLTGNRDFSDVLDNQEQYDKIIKSWNKTEDTIDEKATSKAQQKFMGMVHGVQKGKINPSEVDGSVNKAANSMSHSDAEDFASTKHDGLPEKVKEDHDSEILTRSLQKELSLKQQLLDKKV